MQGAEFPESEVLEAVRNTGISSSYGGCGPIAMMGILDYFSRYLGYTQIIEDPTNSRQRVRLAEDVLNQVSTYEIGENTLALPWAYVNGFNELIKRYGLEGNIVASTEFNFATPNHKDRYMKIIKKYITKGIPVTMFTGLNTGEHAFSEHYVNVYAYEDWLGTETTTGEKITKTFLKARLNWDDTDADIYYCDSEILNSSMCGVVYYDVNYDYLKTVSASDFASQFVNLETNQGQYFNEEKSASITSASDYTFDTTRLRCSYIENQYLVLSANKQGAGEAYLEFNLPTNVRGINFDMSLWSSKENIYTGGKLVLQIPEIYGNGLIRWTDYITFNISTLSTDKANQDNFNILFPKNISRFRILVTKESPSGDRNKGRVVLDNIKFYYNTEDSPHRHVYHYYSITDTNHTGICSCGKTTTNMHVVRSSDTIGKRYANCIECGKLIDLSSDIVSIIPYNLNDEIEVINRNDISSIGIIVLKDEDAMLYLAGKLSIFDDEEN